MTGQNQDLSAAFASAQPSIPTSEIDRLYRVLAGVCEQIEATPLKDMSWAYDCLTDPRIHQSGDEGLRIWAVRIARHAVKERVNHPLFGAFLEDHVTDPSVNVRRQVAWAARECILRDDPDRAIRIANTLKDDKDLAIQFDVTEIFRHLKISLPSDQPGAQPA